MQANDEVIFEATLFPYRSLSREGFAVLMTAVVAVAFTAGLAAAKAGAWPTTLFILADAALLYCAFKLNYRRARMVEAIKLTRRDLFIRRIHPGGRIEDWRFEPYWLKVEAIPSATSIGAPAAEIRLSSHGQHLAFGKFLTDRERERFVDDLESALVRCRSHAGGS